MKAALSNLGRIQSSTTSLSSQDSVTTDTFSSYNSPFSSYPLLRNHMIASKGSSNVFSDLKSSSSVDSSYPIGLSLPFEIPDLRPLRTVVMTRLAGPDRFICQYEVPGGGICRDRTCSDLHLSDMDPSGE